MRPNRPPTIRERDFPINRRSGSLVFFFVCMVGLLWSQVFWNWNVRPASTVLGDNFYPIDTSTRGIYESWNSASDFSTSPEYVAFLERSRSGNDAAGRPHISDGLPVERNLPDTRHILCMLQQYPRREPVDKFSIIISFHNERASALVRTIVSVLRRTPAQHLGELILIDDDAGARAASSALNATFLQRLHHKIRWHRNSEHVGTLRSRQMAASTLAQYAYLLFVDAGSEVNVGWLPPLLYRLQANGGATALISPALDVIDVDTGAYRRGAHWLAAGFDWALRPCWFERRTTGTPSSVWTGRMRGWNETLPFLSPTTAAGTFAVRREWFARIGGFDGVLTRWGGETLELSLRAWMCGGHVEIMPCSRVGHRFGAADAESLEDGDDALNPENRRDRLRNVKRIAESWMDDYRPLFYENRWRATVLDEDDPADAWLRQRRLQCHPFRWYLETVFPELGLKSRQYAALGELTQAGRCARANRDRSIVLTECNAASHSTAWALHRNGTLSAYNQTEACVSAVGNTVRIGDLCDGRLASRWTLSANNTLTENRSGHCLDVLQDSSQVVPQSQLVLSECRLRTRRTQIWHFTVKLEE